VVLLRLLLVFSITSSLGRRLIYDSCHYLTNKEQLRTRMNNEAIVGKTMAGGANGRSDDHLVYSPYNALGNAVRQLQRRHRQCVFTALNGATARIRTLRCILTEMKEELLSAEYRLLSLL